MMYMYYSQNAYRANHMTFGQLDCSQCHNVSPDDVLNRIEHTLPCSNFLIVHTLPCI